MHDFFGQETDLSVYPEMVRGLRGQPSFCAMLRHKLELMIRANGGRGGGGVVGTCRELGVDKGTLSSWLKFSSVPKSRLMWETIDNHYAGACERIASEAATRKRKRHGKTEAPKDPPPAGGMAGSPSLTG